MRQNEDRGEEERKKLIYCATPSRIAGNKTAIMNLVTSKGHGPFHPFQAFEYERFEGGPIGRIATIEMCLRAVDLCDGFWMFGISQGTLIELRRALSQRKSINLFIKEFDPEWQTALRNFSSVFPREIRYLSKAMNQPVEMRSPDFRPSFLYKLFGFPRTLDDFIDKAHRQGIATMNIQLCYENENDAGFSQYHCFAVVESGKHSLILHKRTHLRYGSPSDLLAKADLEKEVFTESWNTAEALARQGFLVTLNGKSLTADESRAILSQYERQTDATAQNIAAARRT